GKVKAAVCTATTVAVVTPTEAATFVSLPFAQAPMATALTRVPTATRYRIAVPKVSCRMSALLHAPVQAGPLRVVHSLPGRDPTYTVYNYRRPWPPDPVALPPGTAPPPCCPTGARPHASPRGPHGLAEGWRGVRH